MTELDYAMLKRLRLNLALSKDLKESLIALDKEIEESKERIKIAIKKEQELKQVLNGLIASQA